MSTLTPGELRSYLDEIRRGGGGLSPLACDGASAFFNPDACGPEEAAGLSAMAGRLPQTLAILKSGSRSVVGAHTLPGGMEIVAKYYYPRSFIKHLTYGIGESRCHQSWIAGLALGKAGIPTPAPLLVAEWRRAGIWLNRSFLATRRAPGIALLSLVHSQPEDTGRFQRIADQLKAAFSIMALHRIAHGDMKATNIIVDTGNDDAISFIDLDATEILMPPREWAAARAKDELRFRRNWSGFPAASHAFGAVFSSSPDLNQHSSA